MRVKHVSQKETINFFIAQSKHCNKGLIIFLHGACLTDRSNALGGMFKNVAFAFSDCGQIAVHFAIGLVQLSQFVGTIDLVLRLLPFAHSDGIGNQLAEPIGSAAVEIDKQTESKKNASQHRDKQSCLDCLKSSVFFAEHFFLALTLPGAHLIDVFEGLSKSIFSFDHNQLGLHILIFFIESAG
ncbi:MAG: hypothetical protein BWY75_03705 [bacterium ADurb.Bin425]|nr:MAG: hypothetical protein BWY75_03705 [bacterium ADurb.Bin425]